MTGSKACRLRPYRNYAPPRCGGASKAALAPPPLPPLPRYTSTLPPVQHAVGLDSREGRRRGHPDRSPRHLEASNEEQNVLLLQPDFTRECLLNTAGFRVWRGCPDGIWNLKTTLRKLKASGQGCWLLLLDLVKAFDRCDRTLLWAVMEGLGAPPTVCSWC
jgi:hypothetical protein